MAGQGRVSWAMNSSPNLSNMCAICLMGNQSNYIIQQSHFWVKTIFFIHSLMIVNYTSQWSGVWCPDNCRILLTSQDVKHVSTGRNGKSGLSLWIHADLELNTTNRTSDGRATVSGRWQLRSVLGRSDHSVWHSWDDMGVTQSSE